MDRDLHVIFFRDIEASRNRRRRGTPVFVQLQSDRAGLDLLTQTIRQRRIALPEKPKIDRETFRRFQHPMDIPCARRAGRGIRSGRRASAAADQRRQPIRQGLCDDLRTDEMDMRIDSAGRHDLAFCRKHFRAGADLHAFRHAIHQVGIAGLADTDNAAIPDADVRLDDPPPIDDDRIGDDEIERALARVAAGDWPMPSRITLPPPNLASSPGTVRSRVISMSKSVSARRMRSPAVGPYRSLYAARELHMSAVENGPASFSPRVLTYPEVPSPVCGLANRYSLPSCGCGL